MSKYASTAFALTLGLMAFFAPGSGIADAGDRGGGKQGGAGKSDAGGSGGKNGGAGKHDARRSADGKPGGKAGGGGKHNTRGSAANHGSKVSNVGNSGKVKTVAAASNAALAGTTDPSPTGALDEAAASLLDNITVVAPAMIARSGTILRSVQLPSILLPHGGSDRPSELAPEAALGTPPGEATFDIRIEVATLGTPLEARLGISREAILGTPDNDVNSCRAAIEVAATPFGMLSVRVRAAGSQRRLGEGAISVPLDVHIEYAREGGIEIRQAPIRCDLDASGTVVGLT